MGANLSLPKNNYPPFCPALSIPCRQVRCRLDYHWENVFLSIPAAKWYNKFKRKIKKVLERNHLNPIVAEGHPGLAPLTLAISKSICSSAHAIIDLSADQEGRLANGVLMENGVLRSTMSTIDILLLVHKRTESLLPAEARSLQYKPYEQEKQLEKYIKDWIKKLNEAYIAPIRQVLFVKAARPRPYEVWFHCEYPHHNPKKAAKIKRDWACKNPLSGGVSGYELLKNSFDYLRPLRDHKVTKVGRCYTDTKQTEKGIIFEEKTTRPNFLPHDRENNLYLLDAPISRFPDGNGKRSVCAAQALNWIMRNALRDLRNKVFPKLTVDMEIIDPDSILSTKYPEEEKKLVYGASQSEVATDAWDYGFIVRAPNPYNHRAIILMMAGLHAPATHAAAEVISIPARMRQFIDDVKIGWDVDLSEVKFFEAVFKVRRTYRREDLGRIEWLHFGKLDRSFKGRS